MDSKIQPLTDFGPVEWLSERVNPIGRGSSQVLLRSIIPEGFPSYARVLHPAYKPGEDTPIRWTEIAEHVIIQGL